jgi:aspartyl-tRNA(Asn)/glutamyl-tRNA(Gln) amidotransferase subunit A
MSADLAYLSISELAELLDVGTLSAREVTEAQLARITALDGRLNAYITVTPDHALRAADAADERRRAGKRGPLLGVPLAIKDLFATAGVPTTAGARILADNVPTETAAVVRRLDAAGAVMLGKTNMMEFAYGYPHPDFGETCNPWDLSRTAGGSSGGSAAAVAAGMAYGALGSDTGGSIRSPAAYCGIVGLKATYGHVSRQGVVPLAWSLDHAGPLARTARDTAVLFDAIAGHDQADPASLEHTFEPAAATLEQPVLGLRVGVVEELFERYVEPEVARVARVALDTLATLGVELEPVTLSCVPLVGPTIMPIVQAEATSYHLQTLLERPDDYGPVIRENLRLGALVLAKDYIDAQRMRRRMRDELDAVLKRFDALVFPTQPIVAPLLDAYQIAEAGHDDVLDVEIGHTGLANLTGHPALSVPCGLTNDELPVGLQFTGRAFDERTLFQLGHAFEQATGWSRRPPLT